MILLSRHELETLAACMVISLVCDSHVPGNIPTLPKIVLGMCIMVIIFLELLIEIILRPTTFREHSMLKLSQQSL